MIDDAIGVSGWMSLLVLAHPGCPRQNPESHIIVVCVCLIIQKLSYLQIHTHKQSNKEILLKTSTSLQYATPVENYHVKVMFLEPIMPLHGPPASHKSASMFNIWTHFTQADMEGYAAWNAESNNYNHLKLHRQTYKGMQYELSLRSLLICLISLLQYTLISHLYKHIKKGLAKNSSERLWIILTTHCSTTSGGYYHMTTSISPPPTCS